MIPVLRSFLGCFRPRAEVHPEARFASVGTGSVRSLRAEGPRPTVVEAFFRVVQGLRGPVGLAMAEVHGVPREWIAWTHGKAGVLSGLLRVRDLLGGPGLETAVHSDLESVEVSLDRFGVLELRCGSSREAEFARLLLGLGFRRVPHLSVVPSFLTDDAPWTDEDGERFTEARRALGMKPPEV